jgi:hypothetical protein
MVRFHVPGQGFYDDIRFAGVCYRPAGDNSPGVTIEDYFEHDIGRIGGSAQAVVVEGGVEGAQVKLVDEIIQGVFEGTGDELLVERNGKEQSLGSIEVFIAWHNG